MEDRLQNIENEICELKKDVNNRFEKVENRLDKVENRLDKVENSLDSVQGCLKELISEVKITNNTLQGVFNVGFESLKAVAVQKSVIFDLSIACQKAYEKMNELKAI